MIPRRNNVTRVRPDGGPFPYEMGESGVAKLRVLDLFSGIGGFSLGLERTGGLETVAFCEITDFCRRVLAKNWPGVPIYHDVKTLTGERLTADGIAVDIITAGFPCQDLSEAKQGAEGIDGEQSGLVFDVLRLIGALRPKRVILENSRRLRSRGLDIILSRLDALGYDAEWHVLPALSVGAPHYRPRLYVVAYPHGEPPIWPSVSWAQCDPWPAEPELPRVAHGVRDQPLFRHALGNAVVPQIPELIGRAILATLPTSAPSHLNCALKGEELVSRCQEQVGRDHSLPITNSLQVEKED
jgi:DNA (cytosine-5)-methyltransferase 1